MRRLILLLTMVGLLATATSAGAVTLRYKAKVGDVARYAYAETSRAQTEMDGEQQREEETYSELVIQKIRAVDGDVFTIEEKSTKRTSTTRVEGEKPEKEQLPDETVVFKMDALGRIKEHKHTGEGAEPDPSDVIERGFAEMAAFPERDLKVGDTWSEDKEITEPELGSIKIRYTRKLVALEPYRKHDCAKIETRFEGTLEGSSEILAEADASGLAFRITLKFAGNMTTWFDHVVGNGVAEEATMKMAAEAQLTMPAMGVGEDIERSVKTTMVMNMKTVLQEAGAE